MTSKRSLIGVFMLFVAAIVTGCGGGGDDAPPAAATSASAVIGPAGGTLTGPDGVQVVVPAGALSGNTTIGIARNAAGAPTPLQEGNAPAGPIYEFTPHDVVFNVPVIIRIPVPANAASSEVFMASLGGDWMVNSATLNGAFAEWQRNSFSFGLAGLACAPPIGDLYPCAYPSGGATVTATPGTAITQIAPGWLSFGSGSAGSWRVNPPGGTVSVTLRYRAAPDCSAVGGGLSGNVRLIRWNPAVPLNTPGRVTIVFDQPVALVQQPVTPPPGSFSDGGGPTFRGVGSTTVDVSAHLGDATNVFGFTFSCQRPGRPVHRGGDLITILGPMAAPVGPYTIGGTVSNLTGTGLVLRNNNGNDLTVPANATSFIFNALIAAGALYNVTVQTQPSGQNCTVSAASGTANAPVVNVAVACTATSGGLALVANSTSNNLSIYRANSSTGVLTSLGTVPTRAYPYRIAITPNGLFAYVTDLVGNSVSLFGIDSAAGTVTPNLGGGRATTNPYGIAMDPQGRFLWVANYSASTVSAFAITPATGVLTVAGSPVSTGALPYALAVNPSGTFVYVVNESGNSVSAFSVDQGTGALTLLGGTIANSVFAPHGIAIDPSGQFVYVATSSGQAVAAFRINANGSLTVISYINSNGFAQSVVVHPNGQYVYVANRGGGRNISVFSINAATGALTQVGSPVALGSDPGELGINSTGSVLYVTNLGGNSASAFSIGSGGATLTSLGAATPAGIAPEGIALTPSASYTIGGTVSGLTGTGLMLRNNGGDDEAVPANATSFTFNTAIAAGAGYNVSVQTQSSGQSCTVQNGTGTANANVTNVAVSCSNTSGATVVGPISSIGGSTCAIKSNRSVACWGNNSNYSLGDGTAVNRSSPVDVVGLSDVVTVSVGTTHSCARRSDNTVLCWGANDYGQIGQNLPGAFPSPQLVTGLSGVASLSAGRTHNCVLKTDSTVACWGRNNFGQLGDGTTVDSPTPVTVSGLSGVVAINAGWDRTCAITGGGGVSCWGYNDSGQLGDGTAVNRSTPAAVSGLTGAVAVSSGGNFHTCALKADSTVVCWGNNSDGQLGDSTTVAKLTPVTVSGLTDATAVSTASAHSCAIRATGSMACWGNNDRGQIGDATTVGKTGPTAVAGLTGAAAVATGGSFTCALKTDGTAACWGYNLEGYLGDGSTVQKQSPSPVVGGAIFWM